MNRKLLSFVLLTCVMLITGSVWAQENTSVADTINKQFDALIESSNSFKTYKVVPKVKINQLQRTTYSEITGLEGKIESLNETIATQKAQVDKFKNELAQINTTLAEAQKSKDELSFLGMDLQKSTYQSFVFGIIAVLILLLGVFIFKFNKSNMVTVEARKNLDETEAAFDAYRQKALETQQKLGRQLQDERNKNGHLVERN